MRRDDIPAENMGMGHLDGQRTQDSIEGAMDPTQGAIAQYLDERPVAKFITAAGATIAGAVVAGGLVRRAGIRTVQHAVRRSSQQTGSRWDDALKSYREIQEHLDDLQGISRRRGRREVTTESGRVEWRDDPTLDETVTTKGFHQTQGEIARARQQGQQAAGDWRLRDEIQQEMVRQARRLPYELPGAYIAQRAISDRLLGTEAEDHDVNWFNPLDVAGDFVEQSAKNVAFAFTPFAAGQGAVRQGWRRAMSYGDQAHTGFTGATADFGGVGLQSTLRMVGHEASDLVNRTVGMSKRSGGAFASALRETASRTRPVTEQLERQKLSPGGVGRSQRVAHGAPAPATGPLGQVRTFWDKLRDEWRVRGQAAERFTPGGATKFERAAHGSRRLRGDETDPLKGEFGEGIAQSDYNRRLQRSLIDSGVDEDIAQRFVRHGQVTAPIRHGQSTHPSRRVRLGDDPILDDGDEFWETLSRRANAIIGRDSGQQLSANLRHAMRQADEDFMQNRELLSARVSGQFEEMYDEAVVPGVEQMLGRRRLPFEAVADPTAPNAQRFLLHRTAERMGIGARGPTGVRRTEQELGTQIAERGLDPNNPFALRSHLIDQGDVSVPWRPDGRNLLGLRPLSVRDAMRRGTFDDAQESPEMRRLAGRIEQADDTGFALDQLRVGGMHEGPGGQLIDTGSIRQGIRSTVDRVANEFEIPLLKLKPADLVGYRHSRRMSTGPAIRYSGPDDRQIALGQGDDDLGRLWFQDRGPRGHVTRLASGDEGVSAERLRGRFYPVPTDTQSGLGRFARRLIGDEGSVRLGGTTDWQERLDAPAQQGQSFINFFRRFRTGGKPDLRNPNQFAQELNRRGRGLLGDAAPDEFATGMRSLAARFRDSGFGRNILRNVDPEGPIARAMSYRGRNLVDMDAPGLRRAVREQFDEDLADLPPAARQQTERARANLLNRWRDAGIDEIDQPTPLSMRRSGMNRRSDELRMDLARYFGVRSAARRPQQSFDDELQRMGDEIEDLFRSGAISQQEAAQSRSAIASFSTASRAVTHHDSTVALQQAAYELAEGLLSGPQVLRQAIEDTAFHRGDFGGLFGQRVFGPLRSRIRMRESVEDTVDYNPFRAGQDEVFVPTIGTAFGRDPVRAAGHAAGLTNYRPDQAEFASPIGYWNAHMFGRMNDFLKHAHLGVREGGRYQGSLDMFARGMIGKRAAPLVAGGATALTVDRQAGAIVHGETDAYGDPVYRPLVLGMVGEVAKEAQVAASALWPGGMSGEERRQQLEHGDVPIRRGRWWPFSKSPWSGSDVQYYRPSWYRRLKGAPNYTEQQYGSPFERLMFGYDFSPLRPFDPYRWEREQGLERPYPVSGDYFTGPWGPLRGVLNQTIGKFLKPKQMMHEEEMAAGMQMLRPVGESGLGVMAQPVRGIEGVPPNALAGGGRGAVGGSQQGQIAAYESAAGSPAYSTGSSAARQDVFAESDRLAQAGRMSPSDFVYGSRPSQIAGAGSPIMAGSSRHGATEIMHQMEEWTGIYGFAFGALRSHLGFGERNYPLDQLVLPDASQAYGQQGQFWDWEIGGLGDVPTPMEGQFSQLQVSELARRFVGKERTHNEFNPIPNLMGQRHPWLPGSDHFEDFTRGDPYSISSGILRLPGQAYERFNRLHPDETGRYGRLDQLRILGNVAPWSNEYRHLERKMSGAEGLSQYEQAHVQESMRRADEIRRRHDFEQTEYRHSSPSEKGMNPLAFYAHRAWEELMHADTWVHAKLGTGQTATEHWESRNVYDTEFGPWENPISSFIEPGIQRATQRNPLTNMAYLGGIGTLFGATREAKVAGGMIGAAIGLASGLFGDAHEAATGDRFLPEDYRKEIALDEYGDIFEYVRAQRAANIASQHGAEDYARYFEGQMQRTMYGADVEGATVRELARVVPERKREHFEAMAHAPVEERDRVLSTAGRLERRLYQGLWGRPVEQRPDLGEYFEDRPLPPDDWAGWDPRVDPDLVKIKMMQDQGLNASRMGYYPQEVRQANLMNLSYPDITGGPIGDAQAQRQRLQDIFAQGHQIRRQLNDSMRRHGVDGEVIERPSAFERVTAHVMHGGE